MRVPDSLRTKMMTSAPSSTAERLQRYQLEVSSGLRIHRPSDDPAGAQRVANLRSNLARIDQYSATAKDSTAWLKAEDSALGNVTDALRQIRDNALQAANPGTPEVRAALIKKISSSAGSLMQSLNASDGSRYLFAGHKTNTVPFTGNPPTAVTYAGDDGVRQIPISDGITMNLNHSGSEVANIGGAGDASLPDIFQTITDLTAAIQAGDQTAIAAQLTDMDAHLQRVTNIRAETGVRQGQAEMAMDRMAQSKLILTDLMNETESTDLTEALVRLKEQENVMQAATYVASSIGKGGLLDWIR